MCASLSNVKLKAESGRTVELFEKVRCMASDWCMKQHIVYGQHLLNRNALTSGSQIRAKGNSMAQ